MTWQDLKDEPTADLISYIRCKDDADYKELADAAFMAFTIRFRVEVIDKCRRLSKYWQYDTHTSDMLAEQVFERFLRYPFRFNKEECGSLQIDQCVKVYLFKIAQHCFCDHNRELSQEIHSPYNGMEQVVVEFPRLENLELTEEQMKNIHALQAVVESALATLTQKHKIIYLTYKAYEKVGFKLPRPLLEQLRKETGLNQNSIRVYKKQAFEAVENHKKQHGTK